MKEETIDYETLKPPTFSRPQHTLQLQILRSAFQELDRGL
jgi:hypothetical protein